MRERISSHFILGTYICSILHGWMDCSLPKHPVLSYLDQCLFSRDYTRRLFIYLSLVFLDIFTQSRLVGRIRVILPSLNAFYPCYFIYLLHHQTLIHYTNRWCYFLDRTICKKDTAIIVWIFYADALNSMSMW
jgi:hypothetical protein